MNKMLSSLIALLVILLPVKTQAGDTVFFESLYDIPVMEGLEELSDTAVSFDKAEGRIAYAAALNESMSKEEILSFYNKTLPQLGWQKTDDATYRREGEMLQISFEEMDEKAKSSALVKFSLSPSPN